MQIQPFSPQFQSTHTRQAEESQSSQPADPKDEANIGLYRVAGGSLGAVVGLGAGALKWGVIGGGALGGLGYMASFLLGPAVRNAGFLAGAAIGGVIGGFLGVQSGWQKGAEMGENFARKG